MATFLITAVRVVPGTGLPSHNHIGSVKLTSGVVEDRSQVILKIKGGHEYRTAAVPPARVYVHRCGRCYSEYITTSRDGTTANNLLSLPRF